MPPSVRHALKLGKARKLGNVDMCLGMHEQVQSLQHCLQVKVDGQDTVEEDLRFEVLPNRIRCAMPEAAQ